MEFWSKSGVVLDQTSFVMAWQGDYYLSCSSTRRGVSRLGGGWGGGGGARKLVYGVCGGRKCWGSGAGKLGGCKTSNSIWTTLPTDLVAVGMGSEQQGNSRNQSGLLRR